MYIQVTLRSLKGRDSKVVVDAENKKVKDVKIEIAAKTGIPVEDVVLEEYTQQVDDNAAFWDYVDGFIVARRRYDWEKCMEF